MGRRLVRPPVLRTESPEKSQGPGIRDLQSAAQLGVGSRNPLGTERDAGQERPVEPQPFHRLSLRHRPAGQVTDPAGFNGLTVAAFESRMAAQMTGLIGRYGGTPLVAPALREVPLENNAEALRFGEQLLA